MMKFRMRVGIVVVALLGATPSLAQTPTPTASPQGGNLTEKLDRSDGVVHPKEVDPGIEKPAPKTGDPNVIPPGVTGQPKAK